MKCINCGKELTNTQTKYCSGACQQDFQYKQKIQEWKEGTFNGMKGTSQISGYVKRYMLEKANYKCELCGWGERNPFTDSLPLEIHHKDGNYSNTIEDNLQVLCPNCHSLTDNYRGANRGKGREDRLSYVPRQKKNYCIDCGVEIGSTSTRCRSCQSKNQISEVPISRDELKQLIREKPFTEIAAAYGVTDNCVRKWCDKHNLPRRKMDIKNITDKEWEAL